MKINQALTLLPNIGGPSNGNEINNALKESGASFGQTLSQAISDVNNLQTEAGKAVDSMVSGEGTDLHDVMIAVEKARTSFDLLMEIRNKTIDMYQEIMRIQV
jgi:flagellar hook-basal body complex protein FliE